jgi:hypothetical protein
MKVGDGRIPIDDYERTPEGLMRKILGFTNTSPWTIENRIKEIFAKQGKSRIQITEQFEDEIENPASKWNNRLINNIKSEYVINQVTEYISSLTNLDSKKALIIYLINRGYHITFGDKLRLNEHWGEDDDKQVKEDLVQINTRNILVNAMIDYFTKYNKSLIGEVAFNEFLKKIKKFDKSYKVIQGDDGEDTSIYELAEEYSRKFNEFSSSVVRRWFAKYFDNKDDLEEFMSAVDEYWTALKHYFNPTEKTLFKVFQMAETNYRTSRVQALLLMNNTLGIDLSREVV